MSCPEYTEGWIARVHPRREVADYAADAPFVLLITFCVPNHMRPHAIQAKESSSKASDTEAEG